MRFFLLRQCRSLQDRKRKKENKLHSVQYTAALPQSKKMETSKNNGQNKWEQWAGEKKPSMKRRCSEHNYSDRGIYMITMAIEGRAPLLGKLTGDPNIKEGDNAPHIELSPLGKKVGECWYSIHHYYPAIDSLKLCIMPDHIHGILFVRSKIEKHLGHVINGFKTGCRKAVRELGLLPVRYTAAMPQFTGQKKKKRE